SSSQQARFRACLLRAVGADPAAPLPVAAGPAPEPLRLAYRDLLLPIAAQDLACETPTELFPQVGTALADLAGGVLEAAVALARAGTPGHDEVRFAVIALGKTGGRELNYVSDVDVVYVAEPASASVPEGRALDLATHLATSLQRAVFAPAKEPPIWPVDPNLRPEGKSGPLVRSLASHLAYYRKWAQTWEFQALLKARPAAGDRALGLAYYEATRPFVWAAVEADSFVEDAQAMRRRVEENVPPAEADRQLKLGPGGLRDVEFTVQLLQLVHGRGDQSLRVANTLAALDALCAAGYVGRAPARRLSECYRFLRVLEHRLQLHRLRRTHLVPTTPADWRRLARAAAFQRSEAARPAKPSGLGLDAGEDLERAWRETRREVRSLHEELYYRPLLPATAKLSAGEAVLAPDAARSRLAALGYRDPDGAMRHIAALTSGVTRRGAIQRQLLPVMLGWLAEGADPDGGLLAFRKLSEALGSTHWFLRMLRDSAGAAERLSHALAASAYVAQNVDRSPEVVRWLANDADLAPRQAAELRAELRAIVQRRGDAAGGAEAVRALRRRELTRLATGMALRILDDGAARFAVSSAAGVALEAVLALALEEAAAAPGGLLADLAVIGMGSLGGREMAVGSDADVVFVHQARPGAPEAAAQAQAVAIAARVIALLGRVGPEPSLEIDPDLRPEGRAGELTRSVAAYREYYGRWAQTWERQALLRARPIAGPAEVVEAFMAVAVEARYPRGGLTGAQLKDLRLMKARIDAERLPRGVEPARHLKLGPGGLLDAQWVAQLYQLQHAWDHPGLRVTGTVEALQAAAAAGLIAPSDADALVAAWMQAMSIRNANVLWTGRVGSASDVVPSDGRQLRGVAALLGYRGAAWSELPEDRARLARRARAVFDRLFYA
ncbi:MAG: bifunctional [glutamine synthetase] adenylyltransferase/[glutamine synthetase]-adenylyl-L-tyrosine phosphorylase, partial [Bifidobacteriaceae bacterium]|nr:bifunctional [glutamine synthetase] adenylyltransferase/[glutamine synthetase]-adenylyl-L-tyrosine phosphorylase [Bifidobacteriaceae bacterium]